MALFMLKTLFQIILYLSMLLLLTAGCLFRPAAEQDPRANESNSRFMRPAQPAHPLPDLLVNTSEKTLTVYSAGKAVKIFERLAFGAAGVKVKQRRGDNITPIGRFTLGSPRPSRRFFIFIPFNYPSLEYAQRALKDKTLSNNSFTKIKAAFSTGKFPPQETELGGWLGFHGVGSGNLEIHHSFNWTSGCIALDNDQIRSLASLVRPGMVVEIK